MVIYEKDLRSVTVTNKYCKYNFFMRKTETETDKIPAAKSLYRPIFLDKKTFGIAFYQSNLSTFGTHQ